MYAVDTMMIGVGIVESVRISGRPSVGREVVDVEEVLRSDGTLRVRQIALACDGGVTLATGHDERAIGIDLAARVAFEHGKQALAGHRGGDGDIGGFHKRRTEVHQVDEVLDDAAGFDSSRPSRGAVILGAISLRQDWYA